MASTQPISITVSEIEIALSRVRKSGGLPFISAWVLRTFASQLAPVVCHLFNLSLTQGLVPNSLKIVPIVPIPKVKSPTSVEQHRPISLLNPLLKLLEKIVCAKWITPLINEENFSDQFAFIRSKGAVASQP